MDLRRNIERVLERIAAAARRSGRDPSAVRLVAVSKYVPVERIREAVEAGIRCLGENRVQEGRDKIESGPWPADLEWHLIGRLQSNKTKPAARLFDAVQSVDRIEIARALDRHARQAGRVLPVLLQVHIGGETTKGGFAPEALDAALAETASLGNLRVEGLMAIPPFRPDPGAARADFRLLRELRDRALRRHPGIRELSMGMSHDFEIAVEEGATIVRVGTAVFGERRRTGSPDRVI